MANETLAFDSVFVRQSLRQHDIENGVVVMLERDRSPENRPGGMRSHALGGQVASGTLSESAAIAHISMDDEGRTGGVIQDFDPERDTSDTLRVALPYGARNELRDQSSRSLCDRLGVIICAVWHPRRES